MPSESMGLTQWFLLHHPLKFRAWAVHIVPNSYWKISYKSPWTKIRKNMTSIIETGLGLIDDTVSSKNVKNLYWVNQYTQGCTSWCTRAALQIQLFLHGQSAEGAMWYVSSTVKSPQNCCLILKYLCLADESKESWFQTWDFRWYGQRPTRLPT